MADVDVKAVFIEANRALNNVVQQINDDQWEQKTPDTSAFNHGGVMTLRQVINYHAWDDSWIPEMMAGESMADAGEDKYGTAGDDLLGSSPKDRFADINERACNAVEDLQDLDRIVHFTYGDFPAREALPHVTMYRGFRSYDIAAWLGFDTTMPDALVQGLWDEIAPHAEEWRTVGIFGAKVDVPDSAPLQDRLLGLAGRQPRS